MQKNDFLQLVEQAEFLESGRQQWLRDNAEWMTPEEREQMADKIQQSGSTMAQNAKDVQTALNTIEGVLKRFEKEELPRLRKSEEQQQHANEEEEAKKLLNDL